MIREGCNKRGQEFALRDKNWNAVALYLPIANLPFATFFSDLRAVLALFRNNRLSTAFLLAFYVVLTHLSALLGYVQPVGKGSVGGGVLYRDWFGWAEQHAHYSAIGAVVLVFIQALFINNLADRFRLLSDRTWLPGLFYVLAASCLSDFLFLSPPLVAATLVPLALRRIFQSYKLPNATALVFDAGWWATFGSLFYPPMLFLLLAAYAGVNIMRSFNLREQLVFVSGVIAVLFLAWLWYFWSDRGGSFWEIQFGALWGFYHFAPDMDTERTLKALLMAVLLCTIMLSYGAYFHRKLIQAQKSVAILYWFLFVGAAVILLQDDPLPAHFLLIMPSVGIFMALSFFALRNRVIAEIFHFALLAVVLFVQFLPLANR